MANEMTWTGLVDDELEEPVAPFGIRWLEPARALFFRIAWQPEPAEPDPATLPEPGLIPGAAG